jgi:hypothetical protein
MEHKSEEFQEEHSELRRFSEVNRWLIGVAVVLLIGAGLTAGYGYRQQMMVGQLSSHELEMNSTISQLRGQLEAVTAKLNELTAPPPPPETAGVKTRGPAAGNNPGVKHASSKRGAPPDPRWKKMEAQLDEQRKLLKDTQDEVAKTRSDLEGTLNSTRDDLNGSIARNHEELVALEKRGERSFYEFDLNKSKQFQRVGPFLISLRKVDAKHKHFNLAMIVDDNELEKKNVNLYEPVWIHRTDDPQPVQIVVNQVNTNHVRGYVSAPKYRNSELATNATPTLTPVSAGSQQANPSVPQDKNPPIPPPQ